MVLLLPFTVILMGVYVSFTKVSVDCGVDFLQEEKMVADTPTMAIKISVVFFILYIFLCCEDKPYYLNYNSEHKIIVPRLKYSNGGASFPVNIKKNNLPKTDFNQFLE